MHGRFPTLKAGTVSWEKYSSDFAEKYGVLQMGSALINEKQTFAFLAPGFLSSSMR
jgi:hypothetical protein